MIFGSISMRRYGAGCSSRNSEVPQAILRQYTVSPRPVTFGIRGSRFLLDNNPRSFTRSNIPVQKQPASKVISTHVSYHLLAMEAEGPESDPKETPDGTRRAVSDHTRCPMYSVTM